MSILPDDQRTKSCTICGEELAATTENFYRSKRGKYGLRGECKKCRAALKKIYRAEHEEEIAAYRKQYYVDHKDEEAANAKRYYSEHAEELKAYSKEYREEHIEHYLAHDRQYYAEHREEILAKAKDYYQEHKEERVIYSRHYRKNNPEYAKKYRQDHPEIAKEYRKRHPHKVRARLRLRRSRKRNAEGSHTDAELQILYDWQQGLCCYCSKPVKNRLTEPPKTQGLFDGEHIVPLCRERATDWIWNIVLSCGSCNYTKGRRIAFVEWQPPKLLPYMRQYLEDAVKRQGYELD